MEMEATFQEVDEFRFNEIINVTVLDIKQQSKAAV